MDKKNTQEYTVGDLEKEIDNLFDSYRKDPSIETTRSYFKTEKNYEFLELLKGIWYFYVIVEMPSNNMQVWGYTDKFISLAEFLEGKISIINSWDKEYIFDYFNDHIKKFVQYEELAARWKIESSLLTMSTTGREWLQRLHNDEKVELLHKNFSLTSKLHILEIDNEEKTYQLDKDEFERLIEDVKKDKNNCKLLSSRYMYIANNYKGFIKSNGVPNYSQIAEFIYKKINKTVPLPTISKQISRFRKTLQKSQK